MSSDVLLITGGTGSFGKCFIKRILKIYPNRFSRIIIVSRDEYKQFLMLNLEEFKGYADILDFKICDVRDKDRLNVIFKDVDTVIHAAALKQVPSCEFNPFEAIKTNIIGAHNVIDCALRNNIKQVIALSTDKACAPINLYGATKLCSDKLFLSANLIARNYDTKFSVVRYGNVAGSRGSVIPYFKELARKKVEYFPITDFRMTRFWLKLEQAVDMVINAMENMYGGELFVKKIPSMKITDLAKAISEDIPIKEIGIRPSEKLHEQMITKEDSPNTYDLNDSYVILPQIDYKGIYGYYDQFKKVPLGFEYSSGKNNSWLTVGDMKNMIKEL